MIGDDCRGEFRLRKQEAQISIADGILNVGQLALTLNGQLCAENRFDASGNGGLIKRHRTVQVGIGQGDSFGPAFPAISFTVSTFSNMVVLGSYFLAGFDAVSAKSYMTANPERTFWRFLSCGLNRLRFFIAR
jgi:hypothetical protein